MSSYYQIVLRSVQSQWPAGQPGRDDVNWNAVMNSLMTGGTATVAGKKFTLTAGRVTTLPPAFYLDCFWDHFKGKGYNALQTGAGTTLSGAAIQNAVTLPVVSSTGFQVGEPIVVGSGLVWQRFEVDTIASGISIVAVPRVMTGGIAGGAIVQHAWGNDTHPASLDAYTAFAQFIADALQHHCTPGVNRLGSVGDVNSAGNTVPTGWTSIGTPTYLTSTYVPGGAQTNSRFGTGTRLATATIGHGIRTTASISATPGEWLTLSANAKQVNGTGFQLQVFDKTNTVLIAQLAQVVGHYSQRNHLNLGRRCYVPFVVPAGVTDLEVRYVSTGATDTAAIDDVRLVTDTQTPTLDRYVIEDPGDRPIVWLGDSWGVGNGPAPTLLATALTARFGKAITVVNASVSGNRLDQMNARFATDVLPYRPAYCILQYGTNDVTAGRSQALMEADIDLALSNCRSNGICPVVVGIPPITSVISTAASRNEQVRARVDALLP